MSDIGSIKPPVEPLTELGNKSRMIRALNRCSLIELSIAIGLNPAGICSVEHGKSPAKGGTVDEWQAAIAEYYLSNLGIDIDSYVIPPPTEEALEIRRQLDNILNGVKYGCDRANITRR